MGGTALLEIDFQHWILEYAHDRDVAAGARTLRQRLRGEGAQVFCLRYQGPQPGARRDPSSPAVAFVPELIPGIDDIVLSKHGRDAFSNPDLADNLTLRGIDHLVVAGLLTEHGVQITVSSALRLGYTVEVVASACAGADEASHDRALRDMRDVGAVIS